MKLNYKYYLKLVKLFNNIKIQKGGVPDCDYGRNCNNYNCRFDHRWDIDCRYGRNCRNRNCRYNHPNGRNIDTIGDIYQYLINNDIDDCHDTIDNIETELDNYYEKYTCNHLPMEMTYNILDDKYGNNLDPEIDGSSPNCYNPTGIDYHTNALEQVLWEIKGQNSQEYYYCLKDNLMPQLEARFDLQKEICELYWNRTLMDIDISFEDTPDDIYTDCKNYTKLWNINSFFYNDWDNTPRIQNELSDYITSNDFLNSIDRLWSTIFLELIVNLLACQAKPYTACIKLIDASSLVNKPCNPKDLIYRAVEWNNYGIHPMYRQVGFKYDDEIDWSVIYKFFNKRYIDFENDDYDSEEDYDENMCDNDSYSNNSDSE